MISEEEEEDDQSKLTEWEKMKIQYEAKQKEKVDK